MTKLLLKKLLQEVLNDDIETIACDELLRYNSRGSMPMPSIDAIKYFSKFKQTKSVEVYRGLGLNVTDVSTTLDIQTGSSKLKIKPIIGNNGIYTTKKIKSWSSSLQVGRNFIGKPDPYGGIKKDSLGIMLKTTVNPDQIAIAINDLPKKIKDKCIKFEQNEYLLNPGTYDVEVIEIIGNWNITANINEILNELKNKLIKETKCILVGKTYPEPGFSIAYEFKSKNTKKFRDSYNYLIDAAYAIELSYHNNHTISFNICGSAQTEKLNANLNEKFEHKNMEQAANFLNNKAYEIFINKFKNIMIL